MLDGRGTEAGQHRVAMTRRRRVLVAGSLAAVLAAAVAVPSLVAGPAGAGVGQPGPQPTVDDRAAATEPETTLPPEEPPPPPEEEPPPPVETTPTTERRTTTTEDEPDEDEAAAPAVATPARLTFTTETNVLVPGNGLEGAQATTTTTAPTGGGDSADDESRLIWMIIAALAGVGLLVALLTWRYWLLTRPGLDLDDGDVDDEDGPAPGRRGGRSDVAPAAMAAGGAPAGSRRGRGRAPQGAAADPFWGEPDGPGDAPPRRGTPDSRRRQGRGAPDDRGAPGRQPGADPRRGQGRGVPPAGGQGRPPAGRGRPPAGSGGGQGGSRRRDPGSPPPGRAPRPDGGRPPRADQPPRGRPRPDGGRPPGGAGRPEDPDMWGDARRW